MTTPNGTGLIFWAHMVAAARMLCCCCLLDAAYWVLGAGCWVLSIDVARGCIRFALNDDSQDSFCIA